MSRPFHLVIRVLSRFSKGGVLIPPFERTFNREVREGKAAEVAKRSKRGLHDILAAGRREAMRFESSILLGFGLAHHAFQR